MTKMYCDFCGEEIKFNKDKVTVAVECEFARLGSSSDAEYHFHIECANILRNKVNAFISECREKGDN